MFAFHRDKEKYFEIQYQNTVKHVIPFIHEKFLISKGMRALEIGCGEAGVLKAFLDAGCEGAGVEPDTERLKTAHELMKSYVTENKVFFLSRDIFDVDAEHDLGGRFDVIILKDVFEHIKDQQGLLKKLKGFLKPGGIVFLGFPPWYMPFGGHQQICRSVLSRIPYIHLLPKPVYRFLLLKNKENVEELISIRETGISIERFENLCKKTQYRIVHKRFYLLNPIYEWKFGWKAKTQWKCLSAIPFIRNFFTSCVYYIIQPENGLS
ncbi:MAG: class I SAM-dependent methyltransferase [Chitinophagaceae bacterium]|nr:class I SAM-dependent methyltransferase [Chitinophagaceae bacterium]